MKLKNAALFGSQPRARLRAGGCGAIFCCLLLWSSSGLGGQSTNAPANRGRGFTYSHQQDNDVPWSIHVLKVERCHPDLEFHTTMGYGTMLGMGLVSEQARSLPAKLGKPIAAINGDFYRRNHDYPGDPEGLQIVDGELVSAPLPDRVCLWIDDKGNPLRTNVASQFKATLPDGTTIPFGLNEERANDEAVLYTSVVGRSTRTYGGLEVVLERKGDSPWLPLRIGQSYTAQVRSVRPGRDAVVNRDVIVLSLGPRIAPPSSKLPIGSVIKLSTATIPDLSKAKTAIGGGPTLVRGGVAMPFPGFQMRHPRTAIGWNKDYIFMVEVDGRQRNLSVGMTLPELAAYLIKLGCQEAMNFDGGGSATFWALGNVINSPSEGRERPAANALVLVQKPPK